MVGMHMHNRPILGRRILGHESFQVDCTDGSVAVTIRSCTACTIHFLVYAAWQCAIKHCVIQDVSGVKCFAMPSLTGHVMSVSACVAYLGLMARNGEDMLVSGLMRPRATRSSWAAAACRAPSSGSGTKRFRGNALTEW
jgi:hypothetical protein